MEGSRDYSQQVQLVFSCVPELYAQDKYNYSCYPELLAQHNINYSCVLGLPDQQKTSDQSCASRSTPKTNKHIYIYIYISSTIGSCPIYKTNHHVHMHQGLRPIISK